MWAWIPVFAAASIMPLPVSSAGGVGRWWRSSRSPAARSAAWSPVPWADAVGKARSPAAAMLVSGTCALRRRPRSSAAAAGALDLRAAVAGDSPMVADSAQFSALVSEYSPRTQVGTALTLQVCLGFLLTMVSMRLLPAVAGGDGMAVGVSAAACPDRRWARSSCGRLARPVLLLELAADSSMRTRSTGS